MKIDTVKWLSIFKKYGLEIENVCMREENGNISMSAIDCKKEVYLKVQPPLMLPANKIIITDDKHYISTKYTMETELRDTYNNFLDFILSEERINQQEKLYKSFRTLPDSCKKILLNFGLQDLFLRRTRKQIKIALLSSRTIASNGEFYLIPIIDFLDHHNKEGIAFNVNNQSVTVKGYASSKGEIFAFYSGVSDTFSILKAFAFATESQLSFSMGIDFNIGENLQISISRDLHKFEKIKQGLVLPQYKIEKNKITLSHLWLGSSEYPDKPYRSFKTLWEERFNLENTHKIYSQIKGYNITMLVSLLQFCNKEKENLAVDMIKKCALAQLMTIGESYET